MFDETHDPELRSWVESANRPGCDFPIQNLPLGVFRPPGGGQARIGVAIGDAILDVAEWLPGATLNGYLALHADQRSELRRAWSRVLRAGSPERPLVPQADCALLMPVAVGDFTDFYASIHHATNVGRLFRPDHPLLPNYRHVPIAYHGRASSLVVSGTPVIRPAGQLGEGQFGPTRELDYEVELGMFLGPGNSQGEPIPIGASAGHIAGYCLVNDWSARDIQRWEYQPLGPFLAKNFATSVSPWLVTTEALAPFRVPAQPHQVPVLPYLDEREPSTLDITLEVWFRPAALSEAILLTRSHVRDLYWTPNQMVAHHTSNGCPLRPGDLIASGTVSGPEPGNRGCLLELTARGTEPIRLPNGEQRTFLEDGDEVILRGVCQREGAVPIGLGTCRGIVRPAHVANRDCS